MAKNKQSIRSLDCNCNYILFTNSPSPGDSEETLFGFRVKLPPVYHTQWRLLLIAERQAGKL